MIKNIIEITNKIDKIHSLISKGGDIDNGDNSTKSIGFSFMGLVRLDDKDTIESLTKDLLESVEKQRKNIEIVEKGLPKCKEQLALATELIKKLGEI